MRNFETHHFHHIYTVLKPYNSQFKNHEKLQTSQTDYVLAPSIDKINLLNGFSAIF
jgi:hypothetical protein